MVYQVVIIGGGVAGLTLGLKLARSNVETLVIEKQSKASHVQSGFKIEETRPIIKEGAWCMICLEKKAVSAAEQQQMTC
ncbi:MULTISPECIES: FAD-dependent oxidoreductase [Fictibacillus]|uniref:FAD dependent oxidoreductase domain-containing protein n=1 Tax=Fictibacillus enclensis TaxID=1017270 RepID=A0A0V8JCY8_9BACL|nr:MULTISPECIES: FAD-dependent oxidoreductase [Fictibacillus]KSU84804.1 hypothetical protein AS030_04565 [Fictibacillus enclensis]RXY99539.1 FAD-dependent oxidoreductase [Fictibacillus sp. S7]SCB86036.1 FAD dependent oxidoreductase [Fictibacillus enclensis]